MTDRTSSPQASSSSRRPSLSPTTSKTDKLPPFRYETQPPNHLVSPKSEATTPSFFPSSSSTSTFPPSSFNQLHPPSLPSINDRRHSSASPPPHLPALTLQRPSNPQESGALPPISPLHPFDFAAFDAGRRRGSITDPSLHVASTQRGGSPRGIPGGLGNGGARSPTDQSPSSSSNPNSPTHSSFPPSSYPFPTSERRTSINSITSNNSGSTPNPNSFYSPSPLSSANGQQLPPPRPSSFFPPHHLPNTRDNSISPTSNGRTPTPGEGGYRSVMDEPPSPKSGRPASSEDRMSVDEGPLGEKPKSSMGEGRFTPPLSGLPTRPGLPRHASGSGAMPSRPWTPTESAGSGPSPFGKMEGVVAGSSSKEGVSAAAGEERDRFTHHLPQFDYSQRRHSIAVGYPTPNSSSDQIAPLLPPPPPNWSQAALKRKMSHDRAAASSLPPPHQPSGLADGSEPASPSSGPYRHPLAPGSNSASPSSEGGPLKRRGSAFDSKMTSLSLSERPDGGASLGGGWWADRRDSTASLWSNASHVSSTGGGYNTTGSTQTSYTGGGGGSGSEAGGLGSSKGYAWPGAGGAYHPPGGSRPWQGPGTSASPTDPNLGRPLSRSSSPVGGAPAASQGGAGSFEPHDNGRPVFRDLAGYSMNNGRNSSSARSSATVTSGSMPPHHSSGLPSNSKHSSPSSSVSPVPTSMAPPSSSNFTPSHHPSSHQHDSSSSQGSYQQMSSHLAPPQNAGDGTGPDGETPYSRSPELRVSHKLAERKRRKEMKELFDELRDHLPADRGMKASKWEILSKAVDYINQIKNTSEAKDRELEVLRHELSVFRATSSSQPSHPSSDDRSNGRLPSSVSSQDHHPSFPPPHHNSLHQQHYPPPPHPHHLQGPPPSFGPPPGSYNNPGSYSMGGNYQPPPQSSIRSSYPPAPSSVEQMDSRRG